MNNKIILFSHKRGSSTNSHSLSLFPSNNHRVLCSGRCWCCCSCWCRTTYFIYLFIFHLNTQEKVHAMNGMLSECGQWVSEWVCIRVALTHVVLLALQYHWWHGTCGPFGSVVHMFDKIVNVCLKCFAKLAYHENDNRTSFGFSHSYTHTPKTLAKRWFDAMLCVLLDIFFRRELHWEFFSLLSACIQWEHSHASMCWFPFKIEGANCDAHQLKPANGGHRPCIHDP